MLNDDIRASYRRWRVRYLHQVGVEADGHPRYRVAISASHQARTVSEGQGYGMVIVALMAGEDEEARTLFDGLWEFFNDHRSSTDDRLMDWSVEADEIADPEGNDSAFDGDCDIAFGLLIAARQWGCSGRIDYCSEARNVVDGIFESEIGPTSRLPMLGDWTDPGGEQFNEYTPRISDIMPGHFRAFGRATGDGRWTDVVAASLAVINALQTAYAPSTGLLPDFAIGSGGPDSLFQPAPPGFLEGPHDGHYYYNAGRAPWRLATDALINGTGSSGVAVQKLSQWIRSATSENPTGVRAGYTLDGAPIGNYFTTFFVAPFGVAAMLDQDGQQWLNDIYDSVRYRNEGYYEDSVALLSLLVMTGNFWDPTLMQPVLRPPRRPSGRVSPFPAELIHAYKMSAQRRPAFSPVWPLSFLVLSGRSPPGGS